MPSYIEDQLENYTTEEYDEVVKYLEHSENVLAKQFIETDSYFNLKIDSINKLFCFDGSFFSEPLYLKFSQVADFDLVYSPEEYKDGFLSEKVFGTVSLKLKMNFPEFEYEYELATNVKAKAHKRFFSNKIDYELPNNMQNFSYIFVSTWYDALAAENGESETVDDNTKLQQALALFMLDSINDTDPESLKAHRNRLILAFHPDKGNSDDNKYAQKINAAYDTIIEAMKR
jgi:hypothetical protein